MEHEVLQAMDNVSLYPIFSLLVFFIFFACLFYFVIKADKKIISQMSNIPLESGDIQRTEGNLNE